VQVVVSENGIKLTSMYFVSFSFVQPILDMQLSLT